ncbi:MAG: hypothetical protein M3362_12575 [Acidobacteriota bacterium]|nr:hypothetical protein [Acidobacteriota bacterium]
MRKSILILLCVCGLFFTGCKGTGTKSTTAASGPPKSDVDFAKDTLQLMADGSDDAADRIDWENFKTMGLDVGEQYKKTDDESARDNFRKSFIRGFSNSFKSSGGNLSTAAKWREESKDANSTVVAVDSPNGKTLLLTVTHTDGQQKISAMNAK